jgi:hypothetical protein
MERERYVRRAKGDIEGMNAAQDEGWIQGSLARLETLEAQRQQLAAKGQTAALAEVDEEIRALYEVLESAAGEEQAPANTGTPALGLAPAPSMAPAPMGMPMQAPVQPMQPMQPPMSMGAPSMAMDPMASSTSYALDDDDKPSRGALPFVIGGLVVVALGVGGFFVMNGSNEKEAKPAPTEPAKEIKAGAIAEDTQEPVVAKGANADRTSGTKYREGSDNDRSDARRSSSGSSGASRPRSDKKDADDGRKLTVEKSRDPLAGID